MEDHRTGVNGGNREKVAFLRFSGRDFWGRKDLWMKANADGGMIGMAFFGLFQAIF
jgi:hypothetical protein